MKPGAVYLDPHFKFHDGHRGRKLFIVIGSTPSIVLVVKTTSKQHGRGNTYGCQPGDRLPNFFLPLHSCALDLPTWVCLDEFYDLRRAQAEQWVLDRKIRIQLTLPLEIVRELQVCAEACEDITPSQAAIVRSCFVQQP